MSTDTIEVLYIAGDGRSGSTLLGTILGQLDDMFYAGELSNLWIRGIAHNRLCGCGEKFRQCPSWSQIMGTAFGGMDQINGNRLNRLRNRNVRKIRFPLHALPEGSRLPLMGLAEYPDHLFRLYRGIQTVTGCRFIVDSSGSDAYGRLLRRIRGIDLHVVHLVRDSRAVAYSWTRKKPVHPSLDDGILMPQKKSIQAALNWVARNLRVEALLGRPRNRYIRVRYEDLVDHPSSTLRLLLSWLDQSETVLPGSEDGSVHMAATHSAWGNPGRFRTGTVTLRHDDEWTQKLGRWDWAAVTAVSWPLLRRYGYKLA